MTREETSSWWGEPKRGTRSYLRENHRRSSQGTGALGWPLRMPAVAWMLADGRGMAAAMPALGRQHAMPALGRQHALPRDLGRQHAMLSRGIAHLSHINGAIIAFCSRQALARCIPAASAATPSAPHRHASGGGGGGGADSVAAAGR